MKYKLLAVCLLGLVLVAIPACGSDSKPSSDMPQYREGEAIAIVKAKLPELAKQALIRDQAVWADPDAVVTLNLLANKLLQRMLSTTWRSSYDGNGRWWVSCVYYPPSVAGNSGTPSPTESMWYVYEKTGTLEEIQPIIP